MVFFSIHSRNRYDLLATLWPFMTWLWHKELFVYYFVHVRKKPRRGGEKNILAIRFLLMAVSARPTGRGELYLGFTSHHSISLHRVHEVVHILFSCTFTIRALSAAEVLKASSLRWCRKPWLGQQFCCWLQARSTPPYYHHSHVVHKMIQLGSYKILVKGLICFRFCISVFRHCLYVCSFF